MPTTNILIDHLKWQKVADATDEHLLISCRSHDPIEYATTDGGPPTVKGHLYIASRKVTRNELGPGHVYARKIDVLRMDAALLVVSKSASL
ncbi:MAG TPA: hypothetical protein PL143_08710 [Rhodocyclaceae bacterium]|nr:hypothetical protein [Rhodocyclaceae bacterium]